MSQHSQKVLVAMSGGVDSSVVAALLKEQGHDVVGVAMNLVSCHRTTSKSCCSAADRLDAQQVCHSLGIPFHSLDYRERFRAEVIQPFVAEYARGKTPIPCISCNVKLKFSALFEDMKNLGADRVATGHYARIERNEDGSCRLLRGVDPIKDQSYYLFHLSQAELKHVDFPVGDMEKATVRKLAQKYNLVNRDKAESQEICFVTDGTYVDFMEQQGVDLAGAGNIVDSAGNVLGKHEGIHAYTVGQRRGLGLSGNNRMYVLEICPEKNEVVVGSDDDLLASEMFVDDLSWVNAPISKFAPDNIRCELKNPAGDPRKYFDIPIQVKIRAQHEPAPARLADCGNGKVKVSFDEPQRAIAPGQAAVFYQGDEVLGGGWIC